eukprot:SAG11_NODE_4653_length_1820_cov_1.856479_2_plen_203_part_00
MRARRGRRPRGAQVEKWAADTNKDGEALNPAYSVVRGPLLYSMPISHNYTVYAHHFGSGDEASNDYYLNPTENWAYALEVDPANPVRAAPPHSALRRRIERQLQNTPPIHCALASWAAWWGARARSAPWPWIAGQVAHLRRRRAVPRRRRALQSHRPSLHHRHPPVRPLRRPALSASARDCASEGEAAAFVLCACRSALRVR